MIIEDRYVMEFTNPNPATVTIGELDIVLPDIPDEKIMFNYRKKIKDQKYTRGTLPEGINHWSKGEIETFVASQWHRRLNGEWWLIKGEPYYIPGGALVFFDYWTKKTGGQPDFREEALEFFLAWYLYVVPNNDIFGLFDLKGRRLGDTEKALFCVWEGCTRYRDTIGGLQSYTDTEAQKNFARLSKANRNMPFFFKPMWSGSDKECLAFMKPNEVMTLKKIREKTGNIDLGVSDSEFLNSYIDYEATSTGKYDGDQLFRYHLDEIWKIKPHLLDAKEQWKNIRKVITLNNEMTIYGKAILSSTIEEKTKDAQKKGIDTTVEMATYFWDNSNPNDLDENGRTLTGMVRLFRDYQLAAKIDEYGFHKKEEAKSFRDKKLAQYRAKGDFASIIDLYRKEPASAEEALSDSNEKCPLHPELCQIRLGQIKNNENRYGEKFDKNGNPFRPRVVEGELEWENNIPNSRVIFKPKPGGKWHISHQPNSPNNVSYRKGRITPMNMPYYRMGCDPYDAEQVVGKGSDGSFTVKRKWMPLHEQNELEYDEYGDVINVEDMMTNVYVCDYSHRPKNPYDFYRDVVKTCWFFGIAVFIETDKPGLDVWMRNNGYIGFLQYEPDNLLSVSARRKPRQGRKSSLEIVGSYVGLLSAYVEKYIWANHHPRIISNWARFDPAKRTKFDMTVATGYTELADSDHRYKDDSETKKQTWTEPVYRYVEN